MNKASLIFLGSKPIGYHCLEYLLREQESLQIHIAGILTNDNATFNAALSLRQLAKDHQIPVIASLDDMTEVDYLVSVQYHEILKPRHLQQAKKMAINLHMAPLPEYRGCNQFSYAILDEKKEFGTTLHVMDAGIDHGGILSERRFPIPPQCWVDELYNLTFEHSKNLFEEEIGAILKGAYTITPQENLVEARGCSLHFRREIGDIKQIDLNWDAEKIQRHLRATYMPGFEPPYTMMGGQKLFFTKAWK